MRSPPPPTRFPAPSLSKMCDAWTLTVLRLMNRASPISWLDQPAAMKPRTSASRSVRPSRPAAAGAGAGGSAPSPAPRSIRAWRASVPISSSKGRAPSRIATSGQPTGQRGRPLGPRGRAGSRRRPGSARTRPGTAARSPRMCLPRRPIGRRCRSPRGGPPRHGREGSGRERVMACRPDRSRRSGPSRPGRRGCRRSVRRPP